MTHEGRMKRGEENFKKGILTNNADTIYFLKHKGNVPKEEEKAVEEAEEKPKPKKKGGK